MFCSPEYGKRILDMRKEGLATYVRNLVVFKRYGTPDITELKERAQEVGDIRVLTFEEVRETGRSLAGKVCRLQPELVQRDDVYMLNYTSGTTGNSKGIKNTHWCAI